VVAFSRDFNLTNELTTAAIKKILCIEDDRETAALIAEKLTERGFEVVVAYNGAEGFAAIFKTMPDLILRDVNMRVMSGFEVLEHLTRIVPRLASMPFLFLTTLTDRNNELKGRRLGADDYVTKPIDFDVLVAIINAPRSYRANRRLGKRRATQRPGNRDAGLGGARQDVTRDRENSRPHQAHRRFPYRQCAQQAWSFDPDRGRDQAGDRPPY
jgi:DNA-binding response OmpR family regulator